MDSDNKKFSNFSLYSFIIANLFLLIFCLILIKRMRIFKDRMKKKHKQTKDVISLVIIISEI